MLKIEDVLIVNRYAQGVVEVDLLINFFNLLNLEEKRNYLEEIICLIIQSKPERDDIESAIVEQILSSH